MTYPPYAYLIAWTSLLFYHAWGYHSNRSLFVVKAPAGIVSNKLSLNNATEAVMMRGHKLGKCLIMMKDTSSEGLESF